MANNDSKLLTFEASSSLANDGKFQTTRVLLLSFFAILSMMYTPVFYLPYYRSLLKSWAYP